MVNLLKKIIFILAFMGSVMTSHSAFAHKVVMHLMPDFDVIEGEVGFAGGDMMPFTRVDIFDEDNNRLGVVATDKDGVFTFKPSKCVTHIFSTNLGAGHVIKKELLKEDLPSGIAACK